MTTIHTTTRSRLSPERVLAAGYDFSARRTEIFPAVSDPYLHVHELAQASADVTEGTPVGIGINWERCRYDWSQPGSVKAVVTDSNVYRPPNSSWELRARPAEHGSTVEMIWIREFTHNARGRIFGTLFQAGRETDIHTRSQACRDERERQGPRRESNASTAVTKSPLLVQRSHLTSNKPAAERCPNATVCHDPFHLVKAATDALDEIRREVWNDARRAGQKQLAAELKGARFALWKNARNLTERQKLKLARIQRLNQRLYRAYLLCQQLRQIYRVGLDDAIALLDAWLKWGRRCRLEPFVKLARTITEQRPGIEAAVRHGLSNECPS